LEEVISRLEQLKFLDDYSFAQNCARQLFEQKFFAQKMVAYELKLRGISAETAAEVSQKMAPDQKEQRHKFLAKKYPNFRTDPKQKRRAINALIRRGYNVIDL
jgi:SOS response regulatory protein OraA/RecX